MTRIIKKNILGLAIGALMLFAAAPKLQAQTVLQGEVYEAGTDLPLPGVNIAVKGTLRGTTTDVDGKFTIRIDDQPTVLVFSFLGFKTLEVDVTGMSAIRVDLEPEVGELDELIVIGYGAVRKRDVTGAVSQIGSAEITKVTSLNAEQSLSGKVSGVQITTTSGAPGASAAVRIRGVGTFNNSSPIYVVDGVILDDISFLNSSDIQSMEILKDASSTAIYGSRGANGVILVQTKSGSGTGDRPVVNISIESGIQQLERTIDLLNGRQFAIIANEIRPGSYNNVDAVPNTNWQDLVFDVAPIQNHQISVSGSSDRGDYYVSLGYFQQSGIIEKSEYERLNLKFNNTYKISQDFKIGNNITIAPYQQQNAPNATFAVYRAQPVLEPYYEDGSYGVVYNVGNPLADIDNSNNFNSGARIVGNVFAEAIFWDAFLVKSSFGVDAALNRAKSFTPAYTVYNPDGTASQQDNTYSDLFKGQGYTSTWLWENTLNYIKDFGKHTINAVGGITLQESRSEITNLSGENVLRNGSDFWYITPAYIVDEANNIDRVNSIFNGVDAGQYYNMMSFLGRAVYSYNDTYALTVTMRRDGSSKFSEKNRWGTFPSFAFAWNINREKFMENLTLFDHLKVRASWGKIGNEKISYYDRYSRVQAGLLAVFGNPDAGYVASTYAKSGNPDLRWETTIQTDIGIEFNMLDNRLSAELDYYNRNTNDILVELSTPGHLGNGQGARIRYNAAEVENKGLEFNIKWEDNIGEVGYAVNAVGNTIKNRVLAVGGSSGIDSVLIGGNLADGQAVTLTKVGLPIGAFYGYVTDGIFQNQTELDAYPHLSQAGVGDLRFKDVNGDGVINGDDRTYIGSPIPDFVFGFNFDLNYKNWDLAIGLQGQVGNEIFNGKNIVRPDPYNFEAHVWNRWTGEGSTNSEPRASYGGYNYLQSDRFIQDGSYLRLRSLIVGYRLPAKISNRLGMQRARLFFKANNLFTFTKYSGYTPEIGSQSVLSNGIDTGIYPIPRVFSVGINTTF